MAYAWTPSPSTSKNLKLYCNIRCSKKAIFFSDKTNSSLMQKSLLIWQLFDWRSYRALVKGGEVGARDARESSILRIFYVVRGPMWKKK